MGIFNVNFGEDTIVDKPIFSNDGKINNQLLNALSKEGIGEFIEKYKGIYFTGDKIIDDQIISIMSKMKGEQDDKPEKLLFMLKKTITQQEFPLSWECVSDENKTYIESILMIALERYSMEDLEMIYSFDNITFDVLNNLNGLNSEQWNDVKEIISLLKIDLEVRFFPMFITTDNLHNVKTNVSYIKTESDSLKLFKNYQLNGCLITNGMGSMIDLLLLPHRDFKFIISSIGDDENILSLSFLGYEMYKIICSKLDLTPIDKLKFSKLKYYESVDWISFRIDKGLPINNIFSLYAKWINISYDQCSYIYENITQDPDKLIILFGFKYETLFYIYNNITDNLDDIIYLFKAISHRIETCELKAIFENIDDYEAFFDLFKKIGEKLDKNEGFGKDTFKILAFIFKHFKDDILYELTDETGFMENFEVIKIFTLGYSENFEFLYHKGICTSLHEFVLISETGILWKDLENLEFLYHKGICTSLHEFVSFIIEDNKGLYNTLFFWENIENLKSNTNFLYDNGMCLSNDDFVNYKQIAKYGDSESLSILRELFIQKDDYKERLNLFGVISNSSYSPDDKNEIIHRIKGLSLYKAKKYVQICEALDKSASFDVQVVKSCLIMDILNSEKPEDLVKKIESVFTQSNLPIVSKIFQVFKYVYSEGDFNNKLEEHIGPSHYLKSCKTHRERLSVIYQDLMNIMIKSGESSLKEFIQDVISCKKLIYDFEKGVTLQNEGYKQILKIIKIIISLNVIVNDKKVEDIDDIELEGNISIEKLKMHYKILKRSLLLKEDDSLYDFFLSLCKKIGYSALEDIVVDMNNSQVEAHNTGLIKYNLIKKGEIFKHSNCYFLKGIQTESFGEILNRGVTSSEYLGGGEGTNDVVSSNGTPFDADGVMVKGDSVLHVAEGHRYGNIAIIIDIDKSQIYNTDNGLQGYNPKMYEIFKNHGEDSDYYGIRTGIASTTFDSIVYKSKEVNINNLQEIKYSIAKKGFYLPILDLEGNLLFTPQEYHNLRQCFSFSDKYQGCDTDEKEGIYIPSNQQNIINEGNEVFKKFIREQRNGDNINVNIDNETLAKLVFDNIKYVLESELGIKCNQNDNLLGAELYDSGSTGRGTEIPSNDIDLDFTLLLNPDDYEKIDEIQKTIHEKIGTLESADHTTVDSSGLQIKSSKNSLGKNFGYKNGIQFDLLILKKTKSYLYPSNVAMHDRLKKIEEMYGKNTLDFVRENIVIMKKLLKSQGIYKNTEGGMGGIGVENRIMQHHGNFIEALESFENIAYQGKYQEGKENIPFEEFKNIYTIWDSGQNFKDGKNDNYITKMNELGYNGILNIIKEYRSGGLNGISKLIQEYQKVKSEFLK